MSPDFVFEPLGADHDRAAFSCGSAALDRYLAEQAGQDLRRRVAAVFVAHEPASPAICGYYTLAAYGIAPTALPSTVTRRLPRYGQLPATRIGRLAVDRRYQGRGLGRDLFMDALGRSLEATQQIASWAIVVDAKDDNARRFYERYGFQRFLDDAYRLYLPMATVKHLLEEP